MDKELEVLQRNGTEIAVKGERKKATSEASEARQRYVYSRKDAKDPVANLIDEILLKCNKKDCGLAVDFSSLVAHSFKLLKDADIIEIQNNSLSDEDRAYEELRKFNIKHETNYTLFEFVLNGLGKKSKKEMKQ